LIGVYERDVDNYGLWKQLQLSEWEFASIIERAIIGIIMESERI
jgi:hypothetical protein